MDIDVQVHPVAALFPMLAEDELRELAEDIRQRGLLQPIVLAPDGSILDGRNRYAACQLAGVEPQYATYEGDDPDGYALAVNIARRHLSKGQKAMIIAMSSERYSRNTFLDDVSKQRVSYARTVHEHAPDLAPRVLNGTIPLNDAYATAQERKREAEEQRRQRECLQRQAADLLSLVDEERMSLADATAALNAREVEAAAQDQQQRAEEARRRQVATELMGFVEKVARLAGSDTPTRYDPELAVQLQQRRITQRILDDARTALDEIEETLKRKEIL